VVVRETGASVRRAGSNSPAGGVVEVASVTVGAPPSLWDTTLMLA
jgi:hypothetical protein